MFGFGESQNAYQQGFVGSSMRLLLNTTIVYQGGTHEAKFSHELVAGAASFEAMKVFENHQRQDGQAVSHGTAKELLAAFAGAEVDKLFESKGLNYIDRERARGQAQDNARSLYDQHYGQQQMYDPNMPPPQQVQQYM